MGKQCVEQKIERKNTAKAKTNNDGSAWVDDQKDPRMDPFAEAKGVLGKGALKDIDGSSRHMTTNKKSKEMTRNRRTRGDARDTHGLS